IVLFVISRIFAEYPGIITSFAIIGAGLAVALQDVVKDFIGWLVIVQNRRFSLGQRITVGGNTGDVIDIGPLRTTLLEVATAPGNADLERTGRTLYLPNSVVLSQALLNYNTTSDFIKAEMEVVITYESDWKEGEKILMDILKEENEEFAEKARRQSLTRTQQFYFSHELRAPVVFMDLANDGVRFILRYYVPIGERRLIGTSIAKKILDRFAAASPPIQLAYKTTRVFSSSVTIAP
ncbi:mechanosensitive ion channel, partial [Candidatus Peregrinibacteria bacterium]|nr:mechanosensitive ion channel [Candidatus Peregrinibacteria bacterium]